MSFATVVEEQFDKLRGLLLAHGYDRNRSAIQILSRLRKAMKDFGYSFRDDEVHHV